VVNPPAGSILRAITVPEYGGDTTWTNLVAAYDGLSDRSRQAVQRGGFPLLKPRQAVAQA